MEFKDDKVKEIQLAYIGGGSRGWAWTFMTDLALEDQISGTIRLYDIDTQAAESNEIIGNRLRERPDVKGEWKYVTAGSLEEVLRGADFVVISILPGTFDEMEADVHEPEKYGIYQSVGDTAGPGGLMRALRTVPMYIEIAEAIKTWSPNAWVINYTNPMAVCVKTLYRVFPEIKAFGCCHEVFGTQKILASMCEEQLGIKGVKRQDIHVNVLGVNHFTWFNQASYQGYNLLPRYAVFAQKYYKDGYEERDENWMNSSFACAHRVKFDLFKKYGLIAAAGDRHLAEFLPPFYLENPECVREWKFSLTTVAYRKEEQKKRHNRSEKLSSGREEIELIDTGEEGIQLIKALAGLGQIVSNVNIPNYGQIPNLPLGTIVETNALFERDCVRPVFAGEVPMQIYELLRPHVENQEDILNAAFTCNRELAIKAFCKEPLVTICEEDARTLFDAMIEKTRRYLPEGWRRENKA